MRERDENRQIGLYREGLYTEKPPNDYSTILAPMGEPLAVMESMYETLPPCGCGGEILWDEYGRAPGSRRCGTCGARYVLHSLRAPDGKQWPWETGELVPLDEE